MPDQSLDGVWRYTAYEEGGVKRLPEQLASMGKIVLLVGEYLPGWDGLWAVVAYGYQGGMCSEVEVRAACCHLILGSEREGEPVAGDFYLWTGGRFRVTHQRSPGEIDFEPYWRGQVLPLPNLGLYTLEQGRLILCLGEAGRPRPSGFNSGEQPHQSLGELVRAVGA